MADFSAWLTRPCCCRREQQHAYIYLYSPTMANSSSSSSSHCCLVCILFGLCLAFVVILAAVVIYHLNSNDFILLPTSTVDSRMQAITKKRQLPDFVNININPCEHFYEFVCDKWTKRKDLEKFHNDKYEEEEFEEKWTYIRHKFHNKLMTNINNRSISIENNHTSFIYHFYQLCENQSPELLLDELERYFANLSQQEPYRSYLTLFNQTKKKNFILTSSISLFPNPFFNILPLSLNSSMINRVYYRPLPSAISIFPNLTLLNETAFKNLIKFDNDYHKILFEENNLIKLYEQEYNQDSLIIKRILSYSNYHLCLSSLISNTSKNGLEQLIELLNYFLHSRLQNFNTKSIDKQIRILDKITDNHTLVEHLQRIKTDLKTIEEIILLNNSQNSCIIDLLDKLLDKKFTSNELISIINFYSLNQTITTEFFISNHWPFLIMLYDRLLKHTSIDTLVNFAFFHYYRQIIYPYYQPYIQHINYININHSRKYYGYTYQTNYSNISCHIKSCFDIFNCYHPSLLNQLMDNQNQTFVNITKSLVENLIDNFRLLTEQSDHLYINEKKQILNELNQIHIHIGHYSLFHNISLINKLSSYLEYVKLFSSYEYDEQERSYSIEPIYYPLNYTLFLPYGFLFLPNKSIEYHIIKLLLKIIRLNIQSNSYHIECLIKSSGDDEQDLLNLTKIISNDEHIVYLLLRSKFISEQKIIFDDYLWPFMSANLLMKHFLIDYTAKNYCLNFNGYDLYRNNTYFIDDIHLIFLCQQASSIEQSKCTVN